MGASGDEFIEWEAEKETKILSKLTNLTTEIDKLNRAVEGLTKKIDRLDNRIIGVINDKKLD